MVAMVNKANDVIRLEKETVIPIMKPKLIMKLASLIEHGNDRAEFLKFSKRVEYTIRAWFHLQFEELMVSQLYSLFDPINGSKRLKQENFSEEKIDELEMNFLIHLFQIMEKSNFKIMNDEELEIARSGQYLLNLPIKVDESKLDDRLFPRYFAMNPVEDLPGFSEKYIIFRRGTGLDKISNYFIMEKLDMIVGRIWGFFLSMTRVGKILSKGKEVISKKDSKKNEAVSQKAENDIFVERIRIENMDLSLRNLLGRITIQEPTFERVIVIYRKVSTTKEKERGIYLKHFKNIPMADMELVLPEKQNPTLTPMDWLKFFVTAFVGLIALISSLDVPKADIWVIIAILTGLIGYCAKIYFTFQQNMAAYQSLITRSMYDKQLDSGKGTLLHLFDDVIQQEVKEVIISYYILMEQGRATTQDLDMHCEQLIQEQFNETCNFDVEDAVQKLEKLRIVTRDSIGRISCVSLKQANEIIGPTTEELVIKLKQTASSRSNA